jgi:integrase
MESEEKATPFPGVRFRNHKTIRFSGGQDKYFFIRYHVGGKLKEEGIGWASEGWNAKNASIELAALRKAHLTGSGPQTLKEKRRFARDAKDAQVAEQRRKEKENFIFETYFIENYFPVSQANKKADTTRRKKNLFELWIKPVIGKMPLKDIRPFHMKKIKKNMSNAKNAPRSIQYALAVVRQAYNHAIRSEFYNGSCPACKVSSPTFDNKRKRFLTYEEAELLLENLKERSCQLHNIASLALHCEFRAGEIFDLKWANVDFEHEIINLFVKKSGKNRTVYLTRKAKQLLIQLQKEIPEDFIFTDRSGKGIKDTLNAFMKAVDKLKLNNGITDRRLKVTFHTLRHTYASWLVQQGVDLYTAKELMGHSTLAVTERYCRLRTQNLLHALKKFEDGIKNATITNVVTVKASNRSN